MNTFRETDRAVSPVIGIVLMVAITVMLVALVGTFVLELGQTDHDRGPTTAMSFSDATTDYDPTATNPQDMFVIEFQAGEELELHELELRIRNVTSNEFLLTWDGRTGFDATNSNGASTDWNITHNGNTVTSGAPANSTLVGGDLIVVSAYNASNIADDGTDHSYYLLVVHKETSSTVAEAEITLK